MDAPLSPTTTSSRAEHADELRELRLRAYGPDADIDAEALRRLNELEAAERVSGSDVLAADAIVPASPVPTPSTEMAPATVPERVEAVPAASETATGEASARASISSLLHRGRAIARKRWVIAGVSVLATALVAWGITVAADRPDTQLSQVVTSPEDRRELAAGNLASSFGINDLTLQRYEAYGSLRAWSGEDGSGMRCLILQTEESGIVNASCVPRGLDPTIDYIIYDGMPSELRQDLPIGSAIRFALRGSHVDVTTARAITVS